jgi:hypothetical protein
MNEITSIQKEWQYFRETIEDAREKIEQAERFFDNPLCRAAAYRNLAQVQAMAYNFTLGPSADYPRIFVNTTYQTNLYTLGLPCQDCFYGAALLDGKKRYRLTGRIGSIRWFSAEVQSHIMGDPNSKNIGEYKLSEFAHAGSDTFEVILTSTPGDQPHIPLDPSSSDNFIWIRRIFGDWNDDHGELHIEALDPPTPPNAATAEARMAKRLHTAADFAGFLLKSWGIGLYIRLLTVAGNFNTPAYLGDSTVSNQDVGSPRAYYGAFVHRLQSDEALLIKGYVPDAPYWGIQLGDVWSNSLDFMNHQSDLNMARVSVDADGAYRAVISASDPGIANWMDTCGNIEGIGMIRVFDALERPPLPSFEVVKLNELRSHLAPDTRRVSMAERAHDISYRRESLRKLYGE